MQEVNEDIPKLTKIQL